MFSEYRLVIAVVSMPLAIFNEREQNVFETCEVRSVVRAYCLQFRMQIERLGFGAVGQL